MALLVWFVLSAALVSSHVVAAAGASESRQMAAARPGCPTKCGEVDIPYPFGIGKECAWLGLDGEFMITCNQSYSPPRPYAGELEVMSITVDSGEMRFASPVSYICYDSYNATESSGAAWSFELARSFRISKRCNTFTAIGCSTVAYLAGKEDWSYFTGCMSTCESLKNAAGDDEECTGLGCCQMGIPGNLSTIAVDNDSACASAHSHCINATQGNGYLCNCSKGYQGNPYLIGGCTNINECDLRESNRTVYEQLYPCGNNTKCRDQPGDYDCKCKNWFYRGDGKSVKGCQFIVPIYALAIGATLVALVLLAVILWFVLTEHKRRRRNGFFDKHGGKLLQAAGINIYSEEQLAKITDRYSKSIGKGHFGNVFAGKTEDNQQVAVKRAIIKDSKKTPVGGDFVTEILFQFQMRHTNLVRLVGCCLETEVPMLVFEFVPNGSLSDVLHSVAGERRSLSLPERLDIAIGSAEALAYMHHSHSSDHKRVHGDVKSANILLDDNLSPKVSDFGSSKVLSTASRYVRFVAADMNYVDPVYLKTYRFTEKSDVYSFSVVLLEIITRKPAKYDQNSSLPIDFVKCCKVKGTARKMYDRDIFTDDDAKSRVYMECLDRISELAVRCLKEDEDDRPTMAEVVQELTQVKVRACG